MKRRALLAGWLLAAVAAPVSRFEAVSQSNAPNATTNATTGANASFDPPRRRLGRHHRRGFYVDDGADDDGADDDDAVAADGIRYAGEIRRPPHADDGRPESVRRASAVDYEREFAPTTRTCRARGRGTT